MFCDFLYFTGCRLSEALAIRTYDFDFAERRTLISSLKKRGRVSVRRIPTPSNLLGYASDECHKRGRERLWNFSRTSGWRIVKRVMAQANIDGLHASPKGLRHGFGVRLSMAKIPITDIKRWMGHSDLETTAIYLDVKGEEEFELMARTW